MVYSATGSQPGHSFSSRQAAPRVPFKVLIVDDSRAIRTVLRRALDADTRLEVVGEAADPYEARTLIKAFEPDVLTLDVEMPRMNGLEFLERLIRLRPMPVVMLSSLTAKGSDAAIEALSLGAVDCIGKPEKGFDAAKLDDLCNRVVQAAASASPGRGRTGPSAAGTVPGAVVTSLRKTAAPAKRANPSYHWDGSIVLVGSSTGGVAAIEQVLSDLPPNAPPMVIVQHMPARFLMSLCERLNQNMPQRVQLARPGLRPEQGDVVLAPGESQHTTIRRTGGHWCCDFDENADFEGHRPAAEFLFRSALPWATQCVAVLLTGLGRDGAQAMTALNKAGATTLGQDQASCVVYGMPRAAYELGGVSEQLAIRKVGERILHHTNRGSR